MKSNVKIMILNNELITLHTDTKAITDKIIITNDDLNKNQYTEKELIDNIDNLFQCKIVKSQRNLSNHFIDNYILNPEYNSISKDEDITMETLNLYQPQYSFHTETPNNELIALNNKTSTNELTTLHTETLHTKAIANETIITNNDLNKNQYTEKELIDNIDNLFQCKIVKSQRNLSNHFINNYILNPEYNSISKDEDITMETLNLYQPQYTFHS